MAWSLWGVPDEGDTTLPTSHGQANLKALGPNELFRSHPCRHGAVTRDAHGPSLPVAPMVPSVWNNWGSMTNPCHHLHPLKIVHNMYP